MLLYGRWVLGLQDGVIWRTPPVGAVSGLDLAPLARQKFSLLSDDAGFGLFDSPSLIPGYVPVGMNLDSVAKAALGTTRNTAMQWLEDVFLGDADPTGVSGPRPVMPDRSNRLSLSIGGIGFNRPLVPNGLGWSNIVTMSNLILDDTDPVYRGKLLKSILIKLTGKGRPTRQDAIDVLGRDETPRPRGTSYSDDFNRANEGPPMTGWRDEWNGGFRVLTNVANPSANNCASAYDSELSDVDHWSIATKLAHGVGPAVRMAVGAATFYCAKLTGTQHIACKIVAGSGTDMATLAEAPPNSTEYTTKITGSTLEVYQGVTLKVSHVDTAIPGGVHGGLFAVTSTRTMDDFSTDDGIEPEPDPDPSYYDPRGAWRGSRRPNGLIGR